MKKYLLSILSTLVALTASAVDVRIDVDNPARVEISIDDQVQTGVTAGLNTFDVQPGTYVTVAATPGNMLKSVTETNGDYTYDMPIHAEDGRQFAIISVYSDYGDTYVVVSAPADDMRTSTLALTVDDADAVSAVFPATETRLQLINGLNEVSFDPQTETTIKLTPTGKDFYQVIKNGNVLPNSYSYTIDIADGDAISVVSEYPDIEYPVHFVLEGDGAADFIAAVDVDNRPVFDFLSPGFTVKAGSELKVSGNTREYEVVEFKINGVSVGFANPTTILITEEATLYFNVRKYATFPVTVIIDDPDRVTLYNGYRYNNVVVPLKAGSNVVEVTRTTPRMALVANDGFYVESVVFPDGELELEELQRPIIDLSPLYDNDVINITTRIIDRDKTAAISISGIELDNGFFSFTRADGSAPIETLTDGCLTFGFYDRDNPFSIVTGADPETYVYLNETEVQTTYPASYAYSLTLADSDVVKVFFGEKPRKATVTFSTKENLPAIPLLIVKDKVRMIPADFESISLEVLAGTVFTLTSTGAVNNWNINGVDVEILPGESYTLTVDSDCSIVGDKANGIAGTEADGKEITGCFSPDGKRLTAPAKGLNIVTYSDGTTAKIIIR